ncbi:MAG: hypothetical protein PHI28_16515, partial [Mangrovibacterium sp.]|nr:hypothetical protein [Mangrovibacterium sp.]
HINRSFHLPHGDPGDEVLRELPPGELETLKAHLVSGLLEQKLLRKFRFLGKSYRVAVDATGMAIFKHRHCEHCLTKISSKTGVVTYFHYVLEVKIVTSGGLSVSLCSEFIENDPGRDYEKQDCELKAFVRLTACQNQEVFSPPAPLYFRGRALSEQYGL